MATIFKRPGSPFWWIGYTDGDRRKRLSSGIHHNGAKACPKQSGVWDLVHRIEERQFRRKNQLPPLVEDKSISEFVTECMGTMHGLAPDSIKRFAYVFRQFSEWAATVNVTTVAAVDASVTIRYRDYLLTSQAGVSVKNAFATLGRYWKDARKRNYTQIENPWSDIDIKTAPKKREGYSAAEVELLLTMDCPEFLATATRVSLYTGARLESVMRLAWEDVSFDLNTIQFVKSKTGGYTSGLAPTLREYLEPIRKQDGLVAMDRERTKSSYSNSWSHYARKAGVPGPCFHRLRHTFVTRMREVGVSQDVVMVLANHKSRSMSDHYTHLTPTTFAGELAKLSYGTK